MPRTWRRPAWSRGLWWAMVAATVGVFGLALLPPFVSPEWHGLIMNVFAPLCHQLPGRSPHIADLPIAICDRCTGIYVGLIVGVVTVEWGRGLWTQTGNVGPYVFLGSVGPAGVDWVGDLLAWWSNTPLSRSLTGLLFGVTAASFVAVQLLREGGRSEKEPTQRDGSRVP